MTIHYELLGHLPPSLRDELIEVYLGIERNFREGRWEPSELNGGKLCEIAYSILRGHVDANYPQKASKPGNMVDSCRALEQAGKGFPRSVTIQIPRMIVALYEIRNNRGVGHVGGDVKANHMDSVCVLQMSKWILGELIRIFHSTTSDAAESAVDALSDRELPLIWKVAGRRRVLNSKMSMLEKTLVLLYGLAEPALESEILSSIEHSNAATFRRDVLRPAHRDRLIEYDESARLIHLSPIGARKVETELLD